MSKKSWPEAAIEQCIIHTEYLPLYRLHSKAHFLAGGRYPSNWRTSEHRKQRADRFSPFGSEGFYFGLTLQAAEDEVRFARGGSLEANTLLILVVEACLDNLLYLTAGCIEAVWRVLGLPDEGSLHDMYLRIMNPTTDNAITNAIGIWARDQGFSGLLYPSARYGQSQWYKDKRKEGFELVPAINFVHIGSHLCDHYIAMRHAMTATMLAIKERGGLDKCIPVWAEHNIVLFDGNQVSGDKWGIIYQTFPVTDRSTVLSQDVLNRQAKTYTYWCSDDPPTWTSGK